MYNYIYMNCAINVVLSIYLFEIYKCLSPCKCVFLVKLTCNIYLHVVILQYFNLNCLGLCLYIYIYLTNVLAFCHALCFDWLVLISFSLLFSVILRRTLVFRFWNYSWCCMCVLGSHVFGSTIHPVGVKMEYVRVYIRVTCYHYTIYGTGWVKRLHTSRTVTLLYLDHPWHWG